MKIAIKQNILEAGNMLDKVQSDPEIIALIEKITLQCIEAVRIGNKILFAGNGGSAADAQHLAAELVCRFMINRRALPAIALTTDTSILTAVGNDFGFNEIFSRQIEGLANEGDILFVISTSGKSENIRSAITAARNKNLTIVGLTGERGTEMAALCDYAICIPSSDTARIQEGHILLGHIICKLIENNVATARP